MTWIPQNVVKSGPGAGAAAANKPNVTLGRFEDVLVWPARDSKGVRTVGNIVMKSGAKMFTVYCTPSKQVKSYTTEGDEDMETIKQKFEGSTPGDVLELSEFIQNNIGVDYFILANNCIDGYKRLYGTPCSPMKLKAEQTDDSSGRMIKMTFEQSVGSKYVPGFYDGTESFGAPYETDLTIDVTPANGLMYKLPADAAGGTIALASATQPAGTLFTIIGGGGADPSTLANGATTAGTVMLADGTTWTALEDATITFEIFDDGTDTFFIDRARS
jgi:hypothetical protein